jgi:NTP pyrophosphatase (non-canonical NTP hydrolase)
MTFNKYQEEVDNWISQYVDGYWEPKDILLRLTEETGELAREINDRYGPKKKKVTEDKNSMESEIGDILFTLCCLANSQNINLDECFQKAMDKCHGRDKNRFERKEAY